MTDNVNNQHISFCFAVKPTEDEIEVALNLLDDIEEAIAAKRTDFKENDTEHNQLRVVCTVNGIRDDVYDFLYKGITETTFGYDRGYFTFNRNCPNKSEIEFSLWFNKETA